MTIKNHITAAGNTIVPALLALESLGFQVEVSGGEHASCLAVRNGESYIASDPVTVLGLISLVEVRGWKWEASDDEIDLASGRFGLGG